MRSPGRFGLVATLALSLYLAIACAAHAEDGRYDQVVWKQVMAAKRQQVDGLCDLWFPSYRSQAVGKLYVALSSDYGNIDVSTCHPALRRHVRQAERANLEIAELFAQGGSFPDINEVLIVLRSPAMAAVTLKVGLDTHAQSSSASERGIRIMQIRRDLRESEERAIAEAGLDE